MWMIFKIQNHYIGVVALPGHMEINFAEDIKLIYESPSAHGMQSSGSRTGGTAKVQKGKIINPALQIKFGDIEVGVKFFHDGKYSEELIRENFMFEVAIISAIPPSPNIIPMVRFSLIGKAIVMPFYPMNLSDYIRQKPFRLPRSKIIKIAGDIANGMRIIHEEAKVLHLDLKPCKTS